MKSSKTVNNKIEEYIRNPSEELLSEIQRDFLIKNMIFTDFYKLVFTYKNTKIFASSHYIDYASNEIRGSKQFQDCFTSYLRDYKINKLLK